MSTVISSIAARPINDASFDDLTDGAPARVEVDGSELRVTFDADLTETQQQAIRDRMTTRDDAEQTARTRIAALRIAAAAPTATTDDVKALALAVSAYLLGIEAP